MELKDKSIIITGASSGIGAAAALLFASRGANVVLAARREAQLKTLVGQIKQSNGNAVCLVGDVREESYAKDLVALAEEHFGGLDGAFNNAGTTGDMGPIPDMSDNNWHDVLDVNFSSAFYAAKYQVPAMRRRGGGAIVLTQVLAVEHGVEKIRVNALLPGGTMTPMAGEDANFHEVVRGFHSLKRMAEPSEIAQAALFLLSDQASFVTGSAMLADGGNSINKL